MLHMRMLGRRRGKEISKHLRARRLKTAEVLRNRYLEYGNSETLHRRKGTDSRGDVGLVQRMRVGFDVVENYRT